MSLALQLKDYRLTTAEILYHLPDHPEILQTYVWQDLDIAPQFPVLHKFLDFWHRELDGQAAFGPRRVRAADQASRWRHEPRPTRCTERSDRRPDLRAWGMCTRRASNGRRLRDRCSIASLAPAIAPRLYMRVHAFRRSRFPGRPAGRPRGGRAQSPSRRVLAVRRRGHDPGDDRARRRHPADRLRACPSWNGRRSAVRCRR